MTGNAKQIPVPTSTPDVEPCIQCRVPECGKELERNSILLVPRYYRITQPGRGYAYLCEHCFDTQNARGLGQLEIVKIEPA